MSDAEKKTLAVALAKLGILKGRELGPGALAAFTDALSGYPLAEVLAAIDGAARTPGFLELASITSLIDGNPESEALLAWAGTGGDPAVAKAAKKAVGLLDPELLEADVKFLRRPFLDTYAAMARMGRQKATAELFRERLGRGEGVVAIGAVAARLTEGKA
jgi:hypothetical protein